MTKEERDAVRSRCVSIDNIIISIEHEINMLRTHLDILTKVCEDEPQTEMTTEQIVNELLSLKKILDDGKMPKQRCGNCKHLTYRWNKTWCDIKCDNPHDMVCDKWERSE